MHEVCTFNFSLSFGFGGNDAAAASAKPQRLFLFVELRLLALLWLEGWNPLGERPRLVCSWSNIYFVVGEGGALVFTEAPRLHTAVCMRSASENLHSLVCPAELVAMVVCRASPGRLGSHYCLEPSLPVVCYTRI